MEKRKAQIPLVCHGHSRPIVDLSYSPITPDGFFLVSASKGMYTSLAAESLFSCAQMLKMPNSERSVFLYVLVCISTDNTISSVRFLVIKSYVWDSASRVVVYICVGFFGPCSCIIKCFNHVNFSCVWKSKIHLVSDNS